MHKKRCLISNREQEYSLAAPETPALSIWQSAVLAYVSAISGTAYTSIEQTNNWLRTNPQNPQHLIVKVVCGLLVAEPPKEATALAVLPPQRKAKTRRLLPNRIGGG